MSDEKPSMILPLRGIDPQTYNDTTAWGVSVRRPGSSSYYLHGEFTNLFLDKAFETAHLEQGPAIEAVKQQLWYAFKQCYLKRVGDDK